MSDNVKQVRIQFIADTSKLKKETKDAKKNLEGMKASVDGQRGTWKEFSEAVGKFSPGFKKNTEAVADMKQTFKDLFAGVKKGSKGLKLAILAVVGIIAVKVAKLAWQIASVTAAAYDPEGYEKAQEEQDSAMRRLKTSIGAFTSPVVNTIKSAIGTLLDGIANWFQRLHAQLSLVYGFIKGLLTPVIEAVQKAVEAIGDAWDWVVSKIKSGINSLAGLLGFGPVFKSVEEGAEDVSGAVEDVGEAADYATGALQGFDKLNTMSMTTGDATTADKIKDTSKEMQKLGEGAGKWLTDAVGNFFGNLKENIGNVWKSIQSYAAKAIAWLASLPGKVLDWARKAWENVKSAFSGLKEWFINKLTIVAGFDWSGLWNGFCAKMGGLKDWLLGKLMPVLDFDWGGLWDGFCKAMGGIATWLKDKIVSGVNSALSIIGIGKGSKSSSSSGSSGGSGLGGVIKGGLKSAIEVIPGGKGLTKLLGMAQGGVVQPNNPFPVIVGDNKREPEVISPLSTIRQAVKEALAESGAVGGQKQPVNLFFQIDGKTFARAIYDDILAEGNRRGRWTIA